MQMEAAEQKERVKGNDSRKADAKGVNQASAVKNKGKNSFSFQRQRFFGWADDAFINQPPREDGASDNWNAYPARAWHNRQYTRDEPQQKESHDAVERVSGKKRFHEHVDASIGSKD